MKLTLSSILYLFFRLSPFILVCFFVLGSIINNELKGFVYLVGLIVACVFTALFSPDKDASDFLHKTVYSAANNAANLITLNSSNNQSGQQQPRSLVCNSFSVNGIYDEATPMSIAIFSYTFFYLIFPIGKYNLALYNIPTLIMFPLLILGEIFWNVSYNCFPIPNCIIALIVAGGVGAGWAAIIDRVKLRGLQYFNVGSNVERCTKPSRTKFVCVNKLRTK